MFNSIKTQPNLVHHVQNVFTLLTAAILFFFAGIAVNIKYGLGSLTLCHLCVVGLVILTVVYDKKRQTERSLFLLSAAFLEGTQVGPLVAYCQSLDEKILPTAIVLTTTIFVTFTSSALLTKQLDYLYLYPILSSILSTLVVGSFAQFFFSSVIIFNFQIYAGLVMFCGYILYDTHKMIAEAQSGNTDVVGHTMEFFLDFVGVFVRILAILAKDKKATKTNK